MSDGKSGAERSATDLWSTRINWLGYGLGVLLSVLVFVLGLLLVSRIVFQWPPIDYVSAAKSNTREFLFFTGLIFLALSTDALRYNLGEMADE